MNIYDTMNSSSGHRTYEDNLNSQIELTIPPSPESTEQKENIQNIINDDPINTSVDMYPKKEEKKIFHSIHREQTNQFVLVNKSNWTQRKNWLVPTIVNFFILIAIIGLNYLHNLYEEKNQKLHQLEQKIETINLDLKRNKELLSAALLEIRTNQIESSSNLHKEESQHPLPAPMRQSVATIDLIKEKTPVVHQDTNKSSQKKNTSDLQDSEPQEEVKLLSAQNLKK